MTLAAVPDTYVVLIYGKTNGQKNDKMIWQTITKQLTEWKTNGDTNKISKAQPKEHLFAAKIHFS